jgi:membrane-associated protease RseP (regulator of RpoE activity)
VNAIQVFVASISCLSVLAGKTLARMIAQLLQVDHSIEWLTGWYAAVQAEMLVAKADETGDQAELQWCLHQE